MHTPSLSHAQTLSTGLLRSSLSTQAPLTAAPKMATITLPGRAGKGAEVKFESVDRSGAALCVRDTSAAR